METQPVLNADEIASTLKATVLDKRFPGLLEEPVLQEPVSRHLDRTVSQETVTSTFSTATTLQLGGVHAWHGEDALVFSSRYLNCYYCG